MAFPIRSGRARRRAFTFLVVLALALVLTGALSGALAERTRRAEPYARPSHNVGMERAESPSSPNVPFPVVKVPRIVEVRVNSSGVERVEEVVQIASYRASKAPGGLLYSLAATRVVATRSGEDAASAHERALLLSDRENARAVQAWASRLGADPAAFRDEAGAVASDLRAGIEALLADPVNNPRRLACGGGSGATGCPFADAAVEAVKRASAA